MRRCAWFFLLMSGFISSPFAQEKMSRAEMEAFLGRAIVLEVEDIGEGVTKPWKVTLARRGVQINAIFKSIDLQMDAEARFGDETADEYADSYKHELAAYEVDKLLGLKMLPPAVPRRISGRMGMLRTWIDEVLPRYGHGLPPPSDTEKIRDWIQVVWLFDYLISNVDRRTHNMLMGPGWKPVLIDHSLAFATYRKPVRPIYRFPEEVIDRLKSLDDKTIRRALASHLRKKQIDAFLVRRDLLLGMVEQRLKDAGPEAVFFSLTELLN